ncbi:S1 family peptidase, partial [Nocardia stercoris]|uniref:S1 family peptidase n=1 Tax=Nocardia stercoris TaxID=2483361 RepID=UPI00131A0DDA
VVLGSLGSAQPPTTQPPVTTTKPPVTTTKPPVTTTNPPVTTTKPPVTTTKQQPPAADAILGGDAFSATDASTGDVLNICSFGFNGVDGSGNTVNITAGHCDPHHENAGSDDATWVREGNAGGTYLGTFDKTVLDGDDYSLLKIDASVARRFKNNFVEGWDTRNALPITGTADPVVGAPVCHSGRTTGFSCGVVTDVHQTMSNGIATLNDAIATNLCGQPGDSGGPVVTGTKALGITSTGHCNSTRQMWAEPIKSVLAANPGLKINTN